MRPLRPGPNKSLTEANAATDVEHAPNPCNSRAIRSHSMERKPTRHKWRHTNKEQLVDIDWIRLIWTIWTKFVSVLTRMILLVLR